MRAEWVDNSLYSPMILSLAPTLTFIWSTPTPASTPTPTFIRTKVKLGITKNSHYY